jgi:hypothetical protein
MFFCTHAAACSLSITVHTIYIHLHAACDDLRHAICRWVCRSEIGLPSHSCMIVFSSVGCLVVYRKDKIVLTITRRSTHITLSIPGHHHMMTFVLCHAKFSPLHCVLHSTRSGNPNWGPTRDSSSALFPLIVFIVSAMVFLSFVGMFPQLVLQLAAADGSSTAGSCPCRAASRCDHCVQIPFHSIANAACFGGHPKKGLVTGSYRGECTCTSQCNVLS